MVGSARARAHGIVDHYETYDEAERLQRGIGPLELVRTRELLQRHLPAPPAAVLDVGGGQREPIPSGWRGWDTMCIW